MHGSKLSQTLIEAGVSGSKPIADRPQGKALLGALKAGRAGEAQGATGKLHMIDLGGDVTGNGISKLVLTILSAVAEAERDRIRERIATVKADQNARQRYLGGKIPFGFRLGEDGTLQPSQVQQAAIATARQMRADDAKLRVTREALHERFGLRLSMGGLHGIAAD